MGRLAFKIGALVLALGVAAFVVRASCVQARDPGAQAVREPAAPPAASTSAPGSAPDAGAAGALPEDDSYGIIDPSTKAEPHLRRT